MRVLRWKYIFDLQAFCGLMNSIFRLTLDEFILDAIEIGRVNLGVERAKVFARALQCHPTLTRIPLAPREIVTL